jgi:hypothetical protein
VGFCFLQFHLDHCVIVVNVQDGRRGWLRQYRCMRQKFLLFLPMGMKDVNTTIFNALAAKCLEPKPKPVPGKEWISKGTWKMIANWSALLQSGRI